MSPKKADDLARHSVESVHSAHDNDLDRTISHDSNPPHSVQSTLYEQTPLNGDTERKGQQAVHKASTTHMRSDGKVVLSENDCYELLGYCWPTWKKWWILTVIFVVQVSMNMNAALYANGVSGISEHFQISLQTARVGQLIFLVAYAFGSELWAPWSEELGRWPILQGSLFLVNIWQIPAALAPNYATIIVARFLGGISSAGGSVTLGLTADLYQPEDQGYAVAYVVLSSVGGSIVGPIAGGYIEANLSWRWVFWIQLIVGGATQLLHFFLCPETRTSILVTREAKRRRKLGENIWSEDELKEQRFTTKGILRTWARPFIMFVCEPIVLWLSLLSGFADALIYTFLDSFRPVFFQWGFSIQQVGLAFISLGVGYLLAWWLFIGDVYVQNKRRRSNPDAITPERRLWLLLFTAPLLTIGLFGFAWTTTGPPMPWIVPMIFAALVGIANYAIYMETIDYMVASYGEYAASATGGNALARDFLSGIAAMYASPLYSNLGKSHPLQWASTLLAFFALIFTIPVYLFYWKGPQIRARSKFAQSLSDARDQKGYDKDEKRKQINV